MPFYLRYSEDDVNFRINCIRIIKEESAYFFEIDTEKKFTSVSDLVEYYRHHAIRSRMISRPIRLGVGVLKKTISINENWYMPEIYDGSNLLLKHKYEGSFLVESVENLKPDTFGDKIITHVYNLRFFIMNVVDHVEIYVEEDNSHVLKYILNNKYFLSLKELVMDFCKKKNLKFGIKSINNGNNQKENKPKNKQRLYCSKH